MLIVVSISIPLVTSLVDANAENHMDMSNESIAFDSLGFSRRCA